MKHVSIKVSGKVQGVFFRASAKDIAEKYGINGFVRNEQDGSVYIEAEGVEDDLEKFVAWCQHGPIRAVVRNIQLMEGSIRGFRGFEIKR